ncbi:MAG: S8 family serine peptidase [Corallincola sp.]|nr:S8 family serine peptidase [Corallincola sp.]
MKLGKRVVSVTTALAVGLIASAVAASETSAAVRSQLQLGGRQEAVNKQVYIVQLKGDPVASRRIAAVTPRGDSPLLTSAGLLLRESKAQQLKARQLAVIHSAGGTSPLYHYTQAFNGFSAKLSPAAAAKLRTNPEVVAIWPDRLMKPQTANTPAFLGLTSASGLHSSGVKGEDVVVGVVDTGIWPEHPSFADDGSYGDPAALGWNGACVSGDDPTFSCNNKLIGARYFKAGFEAAYAILPDESISPRDKDGHGSHVAGTAAGNEAITAVLAGSSVATVSGMAPRARVAAYKACWNSDAPESGCFYSDTMAAIDAAVGDGVDVINMSIGGSLTDLTTPTATALLWAAYDGVFAAVSAGNEGPDSGTVGTPAPWVTSVAASTYEGSSVTNAIDINAGPLAGSRFAAVEGGITRALATSGPITAAVASALPYDGCFVGGEPSALDNAAAVTGKIALLSRGSCAFSEKIMRAQLAGAVGVIVVNNSGGMPIVMGGDSTGINIPGVMIGLSDGEQIRSTLAAAQDVSATLSAGIFVPVAETGNLMADFSSRGPNQSTLDVIKPDVTAPGVRILAATTAAPLFGVAGESFAYLQGTSMSSPHVAGLAALLNEVHPDWSPAAIKSALMTTARQDLVKEDGATAADPFDFGAGHVVPNAAADPGLVFDANIFDHLAFLCGIGNGAHVAAAFGPSCDSLAGAGYPLDPSQLNLPSIAIAELDRSETVVRYVTSVGPDASYAASFEAPAGVSLSLLTSSGPATSLAVPAGATVPFGVTFTLTGDAVYDQWVFGALILDSGSHKIRIPLAVKPVAPVLIDAPSRISTTIKAPVGLISFPIQTNYNGVVNSRVHGLVPVNAEAGIVAQDPDATYAFNEDGLGFHLFYVPEGSKAARFALKQAWTSPGYDLDLYVYRCEGWSCAAVGSSFNGDSNEEVVLIDPQPAADVDAGDVYVVFVHGYNLVDDSEGEYVLGNWVVGPTSPNSRVLARPIAKEGKFTTVNLQQKRVVVGEHYFGAISFLDGKGAPQGLTLIDAVGVAK